MHVQNDSWVPNGQPEPNTDAAVRGALLLTAAETAQLLRIAERTLWRDVAKGEVISPVRIGGATRWSRAALEAWIAEGCPPVTGSNHPRRS